MFYIYIPGEGEVEMIEMWRLLRLQRTTAAQAVPLGRHTNFIPFPFTSTSNRTVQTLKQNNQNLIINNTS